MWFRRKPKKKRTLWEKIKLIGKIIKWIYIILKYTFIYVVLKYHIGITDFFFLLFLGFAFKFQNYYQTIINYEKYFLLLALFLVYKKFIWSWLLRRWFYRYNYLNKYLFFLYFFAFFVGIYFYVLAKKIIF